MNQAFILVTVLSFYSSAFAQTNTAATAANAPVEVAVAGETNPVNNSTSLNSETDTSASAAATSAGSVSATAPAATSPVSIRYIGIYEGPNFTADGNNMHASDTYISNRPEVAAKFSNGMKAGVQARISTAFTKNGVSANNETWRLFGLMPSVASAGIVSVDLMPRLMLPTSNGNHNKTMTVSPELLMMINVNPSNSRFSFTYTPQALQYFYSNHESAVKHNAATFVLLHNFDFAYQLNPSLTLTMGFYPEYTTTKQNAFTNDSNEVDVGVSFGVGKGWSLNPYVGFEPVGADSSNLGKAMEAALVLSGTFL